MDWKALYLSEINKLTLEVLNLDGKELVENYDALTHILNKYPLLTKLEDLEEIKALSAWGAKLGQFLGLKDKTKFPEGENIVIGGEWAIITCNQSRRLMIEHIVTYIRHLMNFLTSPAPLTDDQYINLFTTIPKLFLLTSGQSELEREILPLYLPKFVNTWLEKVEGLLTNAKSSQMLDTIMDLIALFPKTLKPFANKINDLFLRLCFVDYKLCPTKLSPYVSELIYLLILTQTKVEEIVNKYNDLMNRSIQTCHYILLTLFQMPKHAQFDKSTIFKLAEHSRATLDEEMEYQLLMVNLFRRSCDFIESALTFNHSHTTSFILKLPIADIVEILVLLNSIPTHVTTLSVYERTRLMLYPQTLTQDSFKIFEKLLEFTHISSLPLTIFTFFKHNYLQDTCGNELWLRGMMTVINRTDSSEDLKLNEAKLIQKIVDTDIKDTKCFDLALRLLALIAENYWLTLSPECQLNILDTIQKYLIELSFKGAPKLEFFKTVFTTIAILHKYQTYNDYLYTLSHYYHQFVLYSLQDLKIREWWNDYGEMEWSVLIHPQFPTRVYSITDEIDYKAILKLRKDLAETFAKRGPNGQISNDPINGDQQQNNIIMPSASTQAPLVAHTIPVCTENISVKEATTAYIPQVPKIPVSIPSSATIPQAAISVAADPIPEPQPVALPIADKDQSSNLEHIQVQATTQAGLPESVQQASKETLSEEVTQSATEVPETKSEFNEFITNQIDKLVPKNSGADGEDDDNASVGSDEMDKMIDDLF
ncbi:hypothetical protein CONCODRAFT_78433 [Conidiobolus coronatus NRRL 28638]|uniref:Pre-rRNA-processing protein RIX1 N-terminal domain-containing protein n=1 Tax=Conidiobolus coronatus (strain ATCC 28846 / CBS 209.66 / NRRL 28638) TaxID=796925 RepID=A0A137P8G3_CONC2|nr:hypothetical protein CONCODRAFT_78433 [Conidiobolus coronatus NRRL 28638]|eukprot:KXN71307.1 hypothetical protein CONCODRAFT_78433 [Conidiobolus coronatus NRRL 28638]